MSKLYTEEQVLNMLRSFHNLETNVQLCMLKLTPIELLSDEEIDNVVVKEYENVGDEKLFPNFTDKDIWQNGFYEGAKWYREQLKNTTNRYNTNK